MCLVQIPLLLKHLNPDLMRYTLTGALILVFSPIFSQIFKEVSEESGISHVGGVTFLDFDNDGDEFEIYPSK